MRIENSNYNLENQKKLSFQFVGAAAQSDGNNRKKKFDQNLLQINNLSADMHADYLHKRIAKLEQLEMKINQMMLNSL